MSDMMGYDVGTDGVTLTEAERAAVSYHFLATIDLEQHLEWEDYPMLTQHEFEALTENVEMIQRNLRNQANFLVPDVSEVLGRIAP